MKKIIAFCLSIVLLLTAFSAVAVSAAAQPTFAVGEAHGDAGDTVTVDVSVAKNSGIVSMKLLIEYDSNALKLTSIEGKDFDNVAFSPLENNPVIANWIDTIHPNNTKNGVVARLTFKILDTAPEGKTKLTLSYDPEDVFDLNFNNVTFAVQNGYVEVKNSNADKNITSSNNTQVSDSSDTNSTADGSSDTPDTTYSEIVERFKNSTVSKNNDTDSDTQTEVDAVADNTDQNVNQTVIWIIIIVLAAVLVAAIAVFAIKSKKSKSDK